MLKKLTFLLTYWFNLVTIKILLVFYKKQDHKLSTFGSQQASWKVPNYLLSKKSICYCAGVGEDITFEKELFKHTQSFIYLFDPTPRAIAFIKKQKLHSKIHFSPWGLWSENSKQKFFAPATAQYVSHSIVNLHHTQSFFVADCKSLEWIMNKMGHKNLDLLKIDIEGAEYTVLNKLLSTSIRPKILAVEFDQPTPVMKTYSMIKKLILLNYTLVDQTGWNFIFIYNQEK